MHVRDCSFAPILRFCMWRQMAPQQTAKFRTAFFGQFFTSLRKDSVASYASIWRCFCRLLEDQMYFATHETFRSYVGRWRHKIHKFAAEIFQNVKKSAAELWQILRMVTIEIPINSTRVMGIRLTISCRYCIAFEMMLLFLVHWLKSICL